MMIHRKGYNHVDISCIDEQMNNLIELQTCFIFIWLYSSTDMILWFDLL